MPRRLAWTPCRPARLPRCWSGSPAGLRSARMTPQWLRSPGCAGTCSPKASSACSVGWGRIQAPLTGAAATTVPATEAGVVRSWRAISRDVGDRLGEASDLNDLGDLRHMTGDYPGAIRYLEEALAMAPGHSRRLASW
jgi:hypothetical protein